MAAIVGAVLLFAMVFTIGESYFLFVMNQNGNYATALNGVQSSFRAKNLETALVFPANSAGTTVRIQVRNTGPLVVNVTAIVIETASGEYIEYYAGRPVNGHSVSNTSPVLPVYVTPGTTSPTIDTGYTATNGVEYTVQVITANGNIFTGGYPFPVGQNVLLAQLSQGVGSFVLIAGSLRYYFGTSAGTATSGCTSSAETQGDGYEVGGYYADVIPYKTCITYSIQMQNVDPFGRSITLNQKSVFWLQTSGTSSFQSNSWFVSGSVVNNAGPYVTITSYSSPVSVPYEGTVTFYFGSSTSGGSTMTETPSSSSVDNLPMASFYLLFGTYSDGSPFAQTIPFTATYLTNAVVSTAGPFSANQGATVTLSLANFNTAPKAYWVNTDGTTQIVTAGTPTTSQIQFTVPSNTAHGSYYAVIINDGVEAFDIEVKVN